MLTPVDIQNKSFKGGIGFDKKDVEAFMNELASDYNMLYSSNVELKDKINTLNESLQHYKSIEDSMQKALTISEKTSEETVNAAQDKARQITTEAELKAESILADAREELHNIHNQIIYLEQQQQIFKDQLVRILNAELRMLDGDVVNIDSTNFESAGSYNDNNFSSGLSDSGLNRGYNGNNQPNYEKSTQDTILSGSSNNTRFSSQYGGNYTGSSTNNGTESTGNDISSLNIKNNNYQSKGPVQNNKQKSKTDTSDIGLNLSGNSRTPKRSVVAAANRTNVTETNSASQTFAQQTNRPQPSVVSDQNQLNNNSSASTSETRLSAMEQRLNAQKKAAEAFNDNQQSVTSNNYSNSSVVSGDVESKVNNSSMLDSEDNYSTGFDFVNEDNGNVSSNSTPITGEVETKVNESTMLDSEDNHSSGFDFVSEDNRDYSSDNGPITGEVETKVNESTMLDSEDNYINGFDYMEEDSLQSNADIFDDNETYSGEVESKVNESSMIDSEDNHSDGLDFVVGNESEEEIPTIGGFMENNNSKVTPFKPNKDDGVLVGDVENKRSVKESFMINNEDDVSEGFKFM